MREFNVENLVISNDFRIRPSMRSIKESNEYRLFKRKKRGANSTEKIYRNNVIL